MSALPDFSAFRPPPRDWVDETRRAAARELLAALPITETPAAAREAWWRLANALTSETLVEPAGCPNGHHVSELAWHADTRLKNDGYSYCRACRREERQEKGWS